MAKFPVQKPKAKIIDRIQLNSHLQLYVHCNNFVTYSLFQSNLDVKSISPDDFQSAGSTFGVKK